MKNFLGPYCYVNPASSQTTRNTHKTLVRKHLDNTETVFPLRGVVTFYKKYDF